MTPSHAYRLVALLSLTFGAAARPRRNLVDEGDDGPPDDLPDPLESGSLIAMQFTDDSYAGQDSLSLILSGEFGLSALRYAPGSFRADASSDAYGVDVYGEFCAFDPAVDGTDPAAAPSVAARAAASEHCGEHRRTLPLAEVIAAAAARDAEAGAAALPVAGLLFHEGYAGAGLLASALAAVGPTRVVAEHPALRDALAACDVIRNRYKSEDCDAGKQRKLVGDVVALLARVPAGGNGVSGANGAEAARGLYLKLPSASAAYLPALADLYPDAPWAFVYRAADEALAKATAGPRRASCVKARRNPSSALVVHAQALLPDGDRAGLEGPAAEGVCALHLAALLDVATRERAATGTGLLVSYELDLRANADAVVERLLPYLGLGEEVQADPEGVRARVAAILSTKSDTSRAGADEDTQWKGESVPVSEEVAAASRAYMSDDMESITSMREASRL